MHASRSVIRPIERLGLAALSALILLCALSARPALAGCVPPTITAGPSPQVICPKGLGMFSITATGTAPLTYRWELETSPGVWSAFSSTPTPLACPAGSSNGASFATMPSGSSTLISIRACVPNLMMVGGSNRFNVRCVVTNSCGSVTSAAAYTVCPADINCIGGATVQDIFDFLSAWFGGSIIGNFNGVGGSTVQDIFDFLGAWFAGCS